MKKFLKVLLTLIISIGMLSVPVKAEEKTYTLEEYTNIIQNEAKKYDIEIDILDYDNNKPITEETINRGLESLKIYYLSSTLTEIENNNLESFDPSAGLMTMPVDRTRREGYYVSNVYGGATIYAEVTAQVDLQNGAVMKVYSATSYPEGEFINFANWEQTGISTFINTPRVGYVKTTVSGRATFQYSDPYTGILTGYISNVNFTVYVYMS